MLVNFRERGREGERGREALVGCLSRTKPATWACALIRDRTCALLVYGRMLQPTEPHRPGLSRFLKEPFKVCPKFKKIMLTYHTIGVAWYELGLINSV